MLARSGKLHQRQRRAALPAAAARRGASRVAAPKRQPQPGRTAGAAAALPEVDATTIAYYAIGASAASFAGTFFLAPRFKSSFKEANDWQSIYFDLLAGGGVPSVTPAAAFAKRKSAVLVDVRLSMKYEKGHPEGARSLPLYIPIQGWGPAATIRRIGFSFFGIYGTELNTSFAEEVASLVPKGREVILVCERGGSLQNKSGTKFGFESRSLKAAYYLRKAGYSKVSYVEGGLSRWVSEGLPLEGGPDDGAPIEAEEEAAPAAPARGLLAGLKLPALPGMLRR
ncbi:hypothetical protein Rsub_06965 [Raphidocelis subcapitata]|uniref:Rhodanese domain-containing protein n=1 Tax=Raphidocelis subcapitata TaxID=307507 RepID=A0A2V0P8X7_9CHLO|nr:hypothetical protein Rsub_06965 [Raphidocelis subcapitata]|eukprot:GBF94343.1 hypothetical protein Rsub_06965 [Raphidocelis subcapitata]